MKQKFSRAYKKGGIFTTHETKCMKQNPKEGNKMEYDNTNRGVLFKNNDKAKETDPDYKGSYMNAPQALTTGSTHG